MRVMVTGGAGYIGSHVVAALGDRGADVLVYDNLSTGHRDAVLSGELVVGDLQDAGLLDATLSGFAPDAVMHFAAFIQVGESVREPLNYYRNNSGNTLQLLEAMHRHKVNRFIFSSTAAVYGTPERSPIAENDPIGPINPYGASKAFIEAVLRDLSRAKDFRYVSLRYFNAAGADPRTRIGERHDPETHLIPLILKTAHGKRGSMTVHGSDYATPDGTCVRDYIHVTDLAEAHISALDHLMRGGPSDVFNCGYGHGYSVKEVIAAAKQVTAMEFPVEYGERRTGDPAVLVADNEKIKKILGWEPRFDDLATIVRTAWEWEKKNR